MNLKIAALFILGPLSVLAVIIAFVVWAVSGVSGGGSP